MKRYNLSLSSRIAGSALILVALGALILLLVEEGHLREAYYRDRRADLTESLHANELRLTQAIDTLRRDARFLANTPPVSGIIRATQNNGIDPSSNNTRELWRARLQQIFAAFSTARSEYYQISYIGLADHGREIVRVLTLNGQVGIVPADRLKARIDQDYYTAALRLGPGRVHLSEISLSRKEDLSIPARIPTIYAATPVFDASGKLFGLIVIGMDMRSLLQSAAAGQLADVSTFITNPAGQYLLHRNGKQIIAVDAGNGDEGIRRDFPGLAALLNPHSPKLLPLIKMASPSHPDQYLAAKRIHYDPDNPGRFLLLGYQVAGEMTRHYTAIPRAHIASGLAALLLICGIVLLTLRRTFSPLKQLAAAAVEISAGNRTPSLPSDGSGEIGGLTEAIRTMLGELSRREEELSRVHQGLERLIAERTEALTEANALLVNKSLERERILRDVEILFQRNQALMKTAMDGIHILDLEGNLVEANDAFYRMLGHTGDLTRGLNVADWDAHFTKEELLTAFKDLIGKNALIETRYRRKDGSIFDVEIACSGVEIHGWGYVYAASRDISERKQADAVLKRKQVVVDTALDGFWLTDEQGFLLEVNEAYAQISGYAVTELLSMHISQLEAQEQQDEVKKHLAKLISAGYDRFETRHRHKDGHEIDIEVSARFLAESRQIFVFCRDITERKQAEEVLKRKQIVIETALDGFWLTDEQGYLLEVNEAYAKISGYTVPELLGMHISQLEAREPRTEVKKHIAKLISTGYDRFETRHRHKDGHEIDIEVSARFLAESRQIFVFCRDITERKQASLELEHSRDLLNEAQRLGKLGSWELDLLSFELHWSDEVYRIFELDPARFAPSYEFFLNTVHPDDRRQVDQTYQRSLRNYRPYSIEHRLLFADGRVKWLHEHCTSTFDFSGAPLRSVGMVQDITERKQAEEEIRALALHDQLTNLPNRRCFFERLQAAMTASVRHNDYGAVLFIDMDNFKTVNDTWGHESGDQMLIEIARRLKTSIRAIDTASRFGGDEFVVLLGELGDNQDEAIRRAGLVAEKIRKALGQPYQLNQLAHHSSPSIGVALYHGMRESMDALLQHADAAMYQAKSAGRNRVCFSSPAPVP